MGGYLNRKIWFAWARKKVTWPVISIFLMLIGLIMILALLWRPELEERASVGLYRGLLLGYSLPLIGALFFLFGVLLAGNVIFKGPRRKIVLPIMTIGFVISAIGLIALIVGYYAMFTVPHDMRFLYLFDHRELLFDITIIGVMIFFAALALILYSLMIHVREG